MYKGMKIRLARLAALSGAFLAVAGLGGCSLLTPTRAEVPPRTVRTKVTTPVIATKGVLTVAIDASDAPQAMEAADGGLVGYSVDVARAIAQRLGLKVSFVTDEGPDVVGSDAADIYIGATSDDESDDVEVAGSYLENAPALFSASDSISAPVSISDLSGMTVGVQSSSAAQDIIASTDAPVTVETYGNVNECLEALGSGEVDLAACDATAGSYLARAHGGAHFVGALDSATSYGIAVRARNADLSAAVMGALDELEADGTLDAIHTAWYGRMPRSIADSMVSGVLTSEERRAAEEEERRLAEEREGEGALEGDVDGE